ncbi:MAG: LuxR C-terminal-related transcriptional regulator [Oscillospiraceae bacterium]|nr:LuxR C-terminal-related transcriptional regulator [Oscillospiraceae bacterium]
MSIPNIQNNKYTPIPLPEVVAPRNKLLLHLSRSAAKKLIFISAPGGAGKTVSALLWTKQLKRKHIWIGLDVFDNSVSIFYKMFCAGILSVQSDNERMTEILQNAAFHSAPVEHTIMLLSEFRVDEGEYILVLDDFHSITNREVLEFLPYILCRLPHSFTTLILSRGEPDKHLSEYIDGRKAAFINADKLSFNAEEIYELFKLHEKSTTTAESESVFAFTGGWAVAVNTIAQNEAYDNSSENALARYIEDNIWEKLDEATRIFLITSAALDELPVALCEGITGRNDAGTILENLKSQNAFVTRTEGGAYCFRPLLLEFLRGLTEYTDADNEKTWCAAAEYYENEGNIIAAARYACKSGNIEIILKVLHRYMSIGEIPVSEYIYHLKDALLGTAFESLCEKYFVLYQPAVYMSFSTGNALKFEKYEDKLKQNLPVIISEYPQFAETAVAIMLLDYRTPLSEHIVRLNEIPAFVFRDYELKRLTYSFQLPFLHRSNRDFYEIADEKIYDKWATVNERVLKNNYKQIIHGTRAGIYLEQNRAAEALSEAQAATRELTDETAKEIRFSINIQLAAVYLALGKEVEFSELIEKVELFINGEAAFLLPNYLAFKCIKELWNGEVAAAHEWLSHYYDDESGNIEPYKLYQHFAAIRAYIAAGDFEKAKALAIRIRKAGRNFHRLQDAAEAGVLLSVVLWAEGKKEEAQEIMEVVLSETQPYSFIRLIADEGAVVLQMLRRIYRKTECADYRGVLDPTYVNGVYMTAYTVSKQRKGIMAEFEKKSVKLSRRQKMIIKLLSQGYKRAGIAEKTKLSLNTVKSHTKLAYEKLGAGNAADAVVKARELGIIE